MVFRGSPAEVMYQHQHEPLPHEGLEDVPQPVVVLLDKLLQKDPAQRFQTPNELLKAMPTITGALDTRPIESLVRAFSRRPRPFRASELRSREQDLRPKVSIARLPVTGSDLFGREEDIAFLDNAWGKPAGKCRDDRCLGRCREVHTGQPLAPTNGC